MKKLILAAAAVFAFKAANAQEAKFGVKGGLDLASSTITIDTGFGSVTGTGSETSFFVGGFADLALSDKFHVQPELLYVAIKDMAMVQIPILAKYQVATGFNLLAGPDLSFFTTKSAGMKSMNYGLNLGASYDATENIVIDARYNLGLANLFDGATGSNSYKLSGIFIGVGYKF